MPPCQRIFGWAAIHEAVAGYAHLYLARHRSRETLSYRFSRLRSPGYELYFSVVSAWEIQIKAQLGRLTLDVPLKDIVEVQQTDNGLQILPMELRHVYALDTLPQVHNDPFDRLLIAQARAKQAHLVTADSQLKLYPVDILSFPLAARLLSTRSISS